MFKIVTFILFYFCIFLKESALSNFFCFYKVITFFVLFKKTKENWAYILTTKNDFESSTQSTT
jgi:hypothetical protein